MEPRTRRVGDRSLPGPPPRSPPGGSGRAGPVVVVPPCGRQGGGGRRGRRPPRLRPSRGLLARRRALPAHHARPGRPGAVHIRRPPPLAAAGSARPAAVARHAAAVAAGERPAAVVLGWIDDRYVEALHAERWLVGTIRTVITGSPHTRPRACRPECSSSPAWAREVPRTASWRDWRSWPQRTAAGSDGCAAGGQETGRAQQSGASE